MSEPYFGTKAAARKAINPPHISLTSDSKGKEPPGTMLRYDGRLTTPLSSPAHCKGFRRCTEP